MAKQQENHESSDLGDLEKLLQKPHDISETCDNCGQKKKVSYSQHKSGTYFQHRVPNSLFVLLLCSLTLSISACIGVVFLYGEIRDLRNDNEQLKKGFVKNSINNIKADTNNLKEDSLHGHILPDVQYDLIHDSSRDTSLSYGEDSADINETGKDLLNDASMQGDGNTMEVKGRWKRSDGGSSKTKKKKKHKGLRRPKGPKKMLTIHLESKTGTHYSHEGKKFEEWKLADNIPSISGYSYVDGDVTVKKDGVYYIYSQLTYYTSYPTISYGIYVKHKEETTCVMKCINSVDVNEDDDVAERHQHCNTAKAVYLSSGDKVFITDQHAADGFKKDVMVEFAPELSFWGIIKLF